MAGSADFSGVTDVRERPQVAGYLPDTSIETVVYLAQRWAGRRCLYLHIESGGATPSSSCNRASTMRSANAAASHSALAAHRPGRC